MRELKSAHRRLSESGLAQHEPEWYLEKHMIGG
jgi:hypothetical protein